jgi:hypothetical protein
VLIQDIKELLSQVNDSLHHTLGEGNQCADFVAKLGASSDADFLIHASPPEGARDLLRNNVMGTFFLREYSFFSVFLLLPCQKKEIYIIRPQSNRGF